MRLTGKALRQFERWYLETYSDYERPACRIENLMSSMQFGVIQDWADSIGYDIQIITNLSQTSYGVEIYDKKTVEMCGTYSTRQEARNAAIEKLNQILNNKV